MESSVNTDPLQAGCNMVNGADMYESRHDVYESRHDVYESRHDVYESRHDVYDVAVSDQESDRQSSRRNGEDITCTDERLLAIDLA
jgi:hypothetical protein